MTEELDAVLFDAGETLFGLSPSREDIMCRVLDESGLQSDPTLVARAMAKAKRLLDEEYAVVEGKDERYYWTKYYGIVLAEIGFEGDARELLERIGTVFKGVYPQVNSWKDFPETKPVLQGLRSRDFRLGVVSNGTDLVQTVLDHLGLTEMLDFVVISKQMGVSKPDPEIFRIAARRAGTATNRAVYIGDRFATDVVGASRAGMNAILVDRTDAYPDCNCIRARDLNFLRNYSLQ